MRDRVIGLVEGGTGLIAGGYLRLFRHRRRRDGVGIYSPPIFPIPPDIPPPPPWSPSAAALRRLPPRPRRPAPCDPISPPSRRATCAPRKPPSFSAFRPARWKSTAPMAPVPRIASSAGASSIPSTTSRPGPSAARHLDLRSARLRPAGQAPCACRRFVRRPRRALTASMAARITAFERGQLDLFRALPGDFAPRDAQDLMAYPFFSLSKTPRVAPIDFRTGSIAIRVEAVPDHGMATIWDADILIWAASQIVEARDAGLRTSRLMAATPYEILTFVGAAPPCGIISASRPRSTASSPRRSRPPSASRRKGAGTASPGSMNGRNGPTATDGPMVSTSSCRTGSTAPCSTTRSCSPSTGPISG